MWEHLPDNVLALIFAQLDIFDKMAVKDVCLSWRSCIEHPDVWKALILGRHHFRDSRMNESAMEILLSNIKFCKHLEIDTSKDCNFRVCSILEKASTSCKNLRHLKITGHPVGQFQKGSTWNQHPLSLKQLLSQNTELEEIDFDNIDSKSFSDSQPLPIGLPHARKLRRLRIVESLESYNLTTLMYLVNLNHFTISVKYLHFGLIKHLSEHSLKRLDLVHKPSMPKPSVSFQDSQWASLAQKSSFSVGFYTMKLIVVRDAGLHQLLNPKMPLSSVVCNKKTLQHYISLLPFLEIFSATLEEFVDFSITKHTEDLEPCDQLVLKFVQRCPRLHTMAIRSVLSSAAVLLMVSLNPYLINLPIGTSGITFDCTLNLDDFPNLDNERKQFIQNNCKLKESFETAMSSLLAKPWRLLNQQEYRELMTGRYTPYFGDILN